MSRKIYIFWSVLHLVLVLLLIFWNYYSNTAQFHGKTIGELSFKYKSLFTPASFTFAIWGVIFIALIVLSVSSVYKAFTLKAIDGKSVLNVLPVLCLTELLNGVWVWAWLNEYLLLSVLIMLGILSCLNYCIIKMKMEIWDAPSKTIAFEWWPLDLYHGWIAVATVANISSVLNFYWQPNFETQVTMTVVMLVVVIGLNIYMVLKRNMREFAAVGLWALFGVLSRHLNEIPAIQWTTIAGMAIIFIITSYHAFQNRATIPFIRKDGL